ncbi:MAG: helix-turn-helix domain-containing protein [Muribaculaceae bacterium]|nr:helix-turn-helix domain-containing protein [Muribaculaceae bacterium]
MSICQFRVVLLTAMLCLCVAIMSGALQDRVFYTIDTRQGLSDNQVLHLMQLPDGRMVISTLGNINIYDATGFDYVHYDLDTHYPLPNYKGHQHVYVGNGNLLWSKSWQHVQCFSLDSNSYISNVDSILSVMNADVRPLDLFVDRAGVLWTVSEDGILDTRYGKRLPLLSTNLQDLETKGDTAMLFYDTGVMEGFDRRSGKLLWHKSAYPDPGAFSATSLVRITHKGDVLQVRGSYDWESILLHFDTDSLKWKEVIRTPYLLHTLAVASDEEVYIASRRGLWNIDLESLNANLIKRVDGLESDVAIENGFNTLLIDDLGGFWIGTYNAGLLYSPPTASRILSRHSLKALGIDSLSIKEVSLTNQNSVRDSDNRLWTATLDGLRMYDATTATDTVLYVEDGLSNNCIKSLAVAPDGAVWASTANGVNEISVTPAGEIQIRAYDYNRGALSGEYLEASSYITNNGWPLLRHPSGWTLVKSSADDVPITLPQPLVKRITVNDLPISFMPNETIELDYDENDIAIGFASLNFANPGSTVWQYRILDSRSKKDSVWSTYHGVGGNGIFHFTMPQQPPGRYRLQVRSAIDNGAPFSEPAELIFEIHRPWWWSNWALVAYVVILLALCSTGWYTYRRIEKRRIEKRHNEEKMLIRMTELIERCNYYEEKIKANYEEKINADKEEVREKPTPSATPQPSSKETEQHEMSQEDKDFIARAIHLVELNMDKNYSVEKLSSDLCMERTGLYKRLTNLLDKSPSAFIRSIRLNHVMRLVGEGKLSMNEIAEVTGFSSSSHMSRCFKEERGCTPTEYARRLALKTEDPSLQE